MKKTSYVWITTQKEFIHYYPKAPPEVNFLRHPHRHMFHFKIYVEVFNVDRDIEFIMLKREVEKHLHKLNKNLKTTSCEMLSDYIYEMLEKKYKGRKIKIYVSEDKENGSFVEYK